MKNFKKQEMLKISKKERTDEEFQERRNVEDLHKPLQNFKKYRGVKGVQG